MADDEGRKDSELKVGILTVSDRCFSGAAEDKSGANLASLVEKNITRNQNSQILRHIVPDEIDQIQERLINWVDEEECDLIFTCGGTGFSARDVTPEATKGVITKEAPGLTHAMFAGSLAVTKMAMLSRMLCGIREKSLIINLPGSAKGSQECFHFVLPALPHALDLLNENLQMVKQLHEHMQASSGIGTGSSKTLDPQVPIQVCPHKRQPETANDKKLRYYEYIAERDRQSPYPMVAMDEAVPLVLKHTPTINSTSKVVLADSLGCMLGEDVFAKEPHPPFPASIKDGYAVLAADGSGERVVIDQVTAGSMPAKPVTSGNCCRITTGAPLPRGADAVIQVEDTELIESSDQGRKEKRIRINADIKQGQDIRPIGFDIQIGEKLLSKGTFLGPAELGLLASAAVTQVNIIKKPMIAILSTGNEIVPLGQSRKPGQIYDSNKTALLAAIQSVGFIGKDAGLASDRPNDLYNKLREAAKMSDIVITTGGVSMGEKDILKPVLQESLGGTIHFGRVHMKPGKPTTFATAKIGGVLKLFFALPGNPVSALVTFYLFVLPAIRKMAGYSNPNLTKIKARMGFSVRLDPRPEYHRAMIQWTSDDGIPVAQSTGSQCSSRLLSMRSANSLLVLPARTESVTEIEQGSLVDALLISHC